MLADDFRRALPELQANAESTMATPCRVIRPGPVTADPVTGADITTGPRQFAGGCKLQMLQAQAQVAESGSGSVTVLRQEVHLPVGAGPFRKGDVVEVLDRDDSPAAVVLRRLRIVNVPFQTWQTAQRLPVEETS